MDNAAVLTPETTGLKREMHQIKVDLGDLRNDVTRLAGDAVHAAQAGASEARMRIDRGARFAAIRGRQSVRAIEDEVTAHPFWTIGGAFAIGVLAGRLLSKRR